MTNTRQKPRSTSVAEGLAKLTGRVAAIEQQLTRAAAAPATEPDSGAYARTERDLTQRQAECTALEARRRAICEFDDQEWRAEMRRYQPRIDAMKRARLERLNAFLAARGIDPEPME